MQRCDFFFLRLVCNQFWSCLFTRLLLDNYELLLSTQFTYVMLNDIIFLLMIFEIILYAVQCHIGFSSLLACMMTYIKLSVVKRAVCIAVVYSQRFWHCIGKYWNVHENMFFFYQKHSFKLTMVVYFDVYI